MNVFVIHFDCECHPSGVFVIAAYNRGHAVKLVGKKLREMGLNAKFDKSHPVIQLDTENKRGTLLTFWENDGPTDPQLA